MRIYFTLLICSLFLFHLEAQQEYNVSEISDFILQDSKQSLSEQDTEGLKIDRQYTNDKTGVTYVYAVQTIDGIPIYNAIASIATRKENKFRSVNESFIPGAKALVKKTKSTTMSAVEAARKALALENLKAEDLQPDGARSTSDKSVFTSELLTDHGASATPMYLLVDGVLKLTWDVSFFPKDGSDYWSMRLDASSGELLHKTSYTVHCKFDAPAHTHQHDHSCAPQKQTVIASTASSSDGAQYNIFPLPIESPIHGDQQIVVDPSDPIASPYGWHDLNGSAGNETTTTEGNNVNAWLDRDGTYTADRDIDGGSALVFDYDYDALAEPSELEEASTTNLFYMCNMMHDFSYAYGFDGLAGNFQNNNYGLGGGGGDEVRALAQFEDGGGESINNANFSTPNDGGVGTMRMYLWNVRNDISVFSVTAPASVAATYQSRTASFGRTIDDVALEGEVAIVDDGVGVVTDACNGIKNGADINGKIALIDRGECEFGVKILDAENNGAIGVIICNDDRPMTGMAPGAEGDQVTIPSVMITKPDCAQLRVFAGSGLMVKFQTPPDDDQPRHIAGSFDNGIVAHEYGHGISNRLTAGPNRSNCLTNSMIGTRAEGEQMGEGWSDYFSLVLTVEPGDEASDPRGIGNYAERNPANGNGIRAYPYSTDLSVNPVTYYDTYEASVPHGVGHIWASMLWDMYWLFVDRYGWDEDFIHGDKGNNMAILLVMEGMKLQPCNPGFVDGRDAILAADMMLNNGANQDIIWEAFARRGLGQYADQGESNLIADGKEDYSIPNQYIKSVKLIKSMTPLIDKGDNITVTLEARNDLDENVNNIQVIDIVPSGAQVDMSTLPAGASVSGDQVTFELASLDAGTQMILTYELMTPLIPSKLIEFDDLESPDTDGARWVTNSVSGNRSFAWAQGFAYSGQRTWEIASIGASAHDQSVFTFYETPITGSKPMLRFAHNFNTDAGNDGGIVEISTDYLTTLTDLGPHMIRNGYNNHMREAGFTDDTEYAFTGSTDFEWIHSYVDLSAFGGLNAYFQFRFASDDNGSSDYWSIDDLTVFEALTYNSEACLSYDGAASMICAEAPEWGTIVEPEEYSSTENESSLAQHISIYPNPVNDLVSIEMNDLNGKADLTIRDISGRPIWTRNIDYIQAESRVVVSMTDWTAGMYIVEITNDDQVFTSKIFKK